MSKVHSHVSIYEKDSAAVECTGEYFHISGLHVNPSQLNIFSSSLMMVLRRCLQLSKEES